MMWWALGSLLVMVGSVFAGIVTGDESGGRALVTLAVSTLILFPLWWLWLTIAGVLQ